MKIDRAFRRENKHNKRKNGVQDENKSVFILEQERKKKAEKLRREREKKERLQNAEEEI